MPTREEIKILGDGNLIWCPWCKAAKGVPEDCDYCYRTVTLSSTDLMPTATEPLIKELP